MKLKNIFLGLLFCAALQGMSGMYEYGPYQGNTAPKHSSNDNNPNLYIDSEQLRYLTQQAQQINSANNSFINQRANTIATNDSLFPLLYPQPRETDEHPMKVIQRKYPEVTNEEFLKFLRITEKRKKTIFALFSDNSNYDIEGMNLLNLFLFVGPSGAGKTYLAEKILH